MLPTLFSYDKKGRVKIWSVETDGATILVKHGLQGGKMQTRKTEAKPKNIGKKNETTAEAQAILEAKSKWNKQKDKNYHEDLEEFKPTLNPMLAMDYLKQGHRILYPAHLQPKLDGVRSAVRMDFDDKLIFESRGNKNYPVIKEIESQLVEHVIPVITDCIGDVDFKIDGELYIHGKSLQNITSAVKKHNELTPKITFEIFDIAVEGIPWNKRLEILQAIEDELGFEGCRVNIVSTYLIRHKDFLEGYHENSVKAGYEGVMLRNINGFYKFDTRSEDLQKYKTFQDKEFPIIGHKVDKDNAIVWIIQVKDGVTCDVRQSESLETRQNLVKVASTYYGKLLKTKFQAYTDDGNLQFPVGIELDRTDI